MTIREAFHTACNTPSDINEHVPVFTQKAFGHTVTEFGVRGGVSTIGWIYGQPKSLISYDINPCGNEQNLRRWASDLGVPFDFRIGDTLKIDIEPTDILFIDTLHTYHQLKQELSRHHDKVKKYLVFHDTTIFAHCGENGCRLGLWPAIEEFLNNADFGWKWKLEVRFENNNGLTILKRIAP